MDGLLRRHALLALRFQREVDHHDGVLFDDADQHQDADAGDHRQFLAEQHQRAQRADGGGGQAGQNGQRVDIAFVQHPQQHVDHRHRDAQQQDLAALGFLEGGGVAAVAGGDGRGQGDALFELAQVLVRLAQRDAGRQVEGQRHRLQLALMVDRDRADGALHRGDAGQLHQLAVGGAHPQPREVELVDLERVVRLQDHLIVVAGGVDGGNLPLAEGAVQRAAYALDVHAQQVGLVAVYVQLGLQALELGVAGDVTEDGIDLHLLQELVGPGVQALRLYALQGVLVAALALTAAQAQVLRRVQVDAEPRHRAQVAAQAFHRRIQLGAFATRLELDEHAAGVAAGQR